jgi:tRNA(adenine34) deaminase
MGAALGCERGRSYAQGVVIENDHAILMGRALEQARAAGEAGEVPVGALIVRDGDILAVAGNAPVSTQDPTGHAEIRALRAAASNVANYRLNGASLYVTLEPCPMCVGAIIHARIERLIFGASDPKTGAAGGAFDLIGRPEHNHQPTVVGGVAGDEAGELLRAFFRARRRSVGSGRGRA